MGLPHYVERLARLAAARPLARGASGVAAGAAGSGRQQPLRLASEQESLQRALAALDALPERQREVLYLRACECLSIAEIAEVLDSNANAVKVNLSLAHKQMRQQLQSLYCELFPHSEERCP